MHPVDQIGTSGRSGSNQFSVRAQPVPSFTPGDVVIARRLGQIKLHAVSAPAAPFPSLGLNPGIALYPLNISLSLARRTSCYFFQMASASSEHALHNNNDVDYVIRYRFGGQGTRFEDRLLKGVCRTNNSRWLPGITEAGIAASYAVRGRITDRSTTRRRVDSAGVCSGDEEERAAGGLSIPVGDTFQCLLCALFRSLLVNVYMQCP